MNQLICPWCHNDNLTPSRIQPEQPTRVMICLDCYLPHYLNPKVPWQKYCLVCHAYIDSSSAHATMCLCPTIPKPLPQDTNGEWILWPETDTG